jgi:hypothetical protein
VQFESLFDNFALQLSRHDRPNDASGFVFGYDHEEPYLTRLSRLSIDPDLLSSDPEVTVRRDRFTRVEFLGYKDIIALSANPHAHVKHQPQNKVGHLRFEHNVFEQILRRIVIYGLSSVLSKAIDGDGRYLLEPSVIIPSVQCGDILTLDRDEIDGYLSIKFLFESYLSPSRTGTRPLSIAVFGPPGSGKNFTVNQILKSVGKTSTVESMTVNLSQLTSVNELARAFLRIQDRALAREVPVAFFDEFDTTLQRESLGWLKFFLSPMQDGKFFDGHDTFHVGPAIFVFGGGTASRFAEFVSTYGGLADKKVPDFISRLRGYLDIRDITAPPGGDEVKRVKVRRALLLRSLLFDRARNVFDETGEVARVDYAVLDAFMHVPSFKHGVRSMEAIIDMSRVGEVGSYQKSSLPTFAQLDMHVDARAFLDLVNRQREDDQLYSNSEHKVIA